MDEAVKLQLCQAVNNNVVLCVKFLSPDMTNLPKGNMERRNVLLSLPSFWMPYFSDPAEDRKLAHIIVNKCSTLQANPEEKARFWIWVYEHVKHIINCYRSNTAKCFEAKHVGR